MKMCFRQVGIMCVVCAVMVLAGFTAGRWQEGLKMGGLSAAEVLKWKAQDAASCIWMAGELYRRGETNELAEEVHERLLSDVHLVYRLRGCRNRNGAHAYADMVLARLGERMAEDSMGLDAKERELLGRCLSWQEARNERERNGVKARKSD